jgi:TIGR03009 family protein
MSLFTLGLCLNVSFVAAQSTRPRPAAGTGTQTAPAANQLPRVPREPAGNVQPQAPAGNTAVRPKAGPQAANVPNAQVIVKPVSDEVWQLLLDWEAKTKGIKSLSCDVKRMEYDVIFATETRSLGRVYFEQPDHGRLDFGPADEKWLARASRVTDKGKAYKVVAGESTTWVCTGQNVYALHHKDKSYDLIDIPPALQGQNITRSPLPFIFGMKAKEAVERYAIKLGKFNNPEGKPDEQGKPQMPVIHIIANPFDPNVAKEYVQAEFLLDPETFLPTNLRMLDPSYNKETVYSFDHSTIKINAGFGLLRANPFKQPNVSGWTLMHHLKDEPAAPLKQADRPTQKQAQR